MATLRDSSCVPCRGGVPPLDREAIEALRHEVPEWDVVEVDGIPRLARTFAFPDFRSALDFTVHVGELAEQEGHHPDIHLAWGRVGVEIWTHKIRGLHRNDFVLAAKIDALASAMQEGRSRRS